MAIKLAAKRELKNLSKQWKRSLIATKLTMNEAQIVIQEDAQIVSKIQYCKGYQEYHHCSIWDYGSKTPNHYKCINVVIDDLPENQHCKDVVIVQQIKV